MTRITPKSNDTFTTELTYLGPSFVKDSLLETDKINDLLESRVLEKITTEVHKTSSNFEFNKHGFEYLDLTQTALFPIIESLAANTNELEDLSDETILEYEQTLEKTVAIWGKSQGITFDLVACLDSTYRNTDPTKTEHGASPLVHLDFQVVQGEEIAVFPDFVIERCVEKFPFTPEDVIKKYTIERIVNLWAPLDKEVEAYPLAIMDPQSNGEALKPEPFSVEYKDEKISLLSITASKAHQWYVKDAMKRGEAIVFDSEKIPHTAVKLPDQGEKHRRSVECRLFFMRSDQPKR